LLGPRAGGDRLAENRKRSAHPTLRLVTTG
jgi:hypothetical protein